MRICLGNEPFARATAKCIRVSEARGAQSTEIFSAISLTHAPVRKPYELSTTGPCHADPKRARNCMGSLPLAMADAGRSLPMRKQALADHARRNVCVCVRACAPSAGMNLKRYFAGLRSEAGSGLHEEPDGAGGSLYGCVLNAGPAACPRLHYLYCPHI